MRDNFSVSRTTTMEADEVLYLLSREGVLIVKYSDTRQDAAVGRLYKAAHVSSGQIIAVKNLPIYRRLLNHKVRKNCANVWCWAVSGGLVIGHKVGCWHPLNTTTFIEQTDSRFPTISTGFR
jgi:hypothetical protein